MTRQVNHSGRDWDNRESSRKRIATCSPDWTAVGGVTPNGIDDGNTRGRSRGILAQGQIPPLPGPVTPPTPGTGLWTIDPKSADCHAAGRLDMRDRTRRMVRRGRGEQRRFPDDFDHGGCGRIRGLLDGQAKTFGTGDQKVRSPRNSGSNSWRASWHCFYNPRRRAGRHGREKAGDPMTLRRSNAADSISAVWWRAGELLLLTWLTGLVLVAGDSPIADHIQVNDSTCSVTPRGEYDRARVTVPAVGGYSSWRTFPLARRLARWRHASPAYLAGGTISRPQPQ